MAEVNETDNDDNRTNPPISVHIPQYIVCHIQAFLEKAAKDLQLRSIPAVVYFVLFNWLDRIRDLEKIKSNQKNKTLNGGIRAEIADKDEINDNIDWW